MDEQLINSLIKTIDVDIVQRILIVIKKEKPFYTDLENLNRNKETSCLIGIFSNQIKNKISPKITEKFDCIFSIKVLYIIF